jgi:hypothetical protein
MYSFENRTRAIFLTAVQTLKESTMSRTNFSLSKQLVVASALAFGASGVALADDNSMKPFSGDSSQNRGNPSMLAQSPCPQGTEAAGTRQKKDEQKIESKTLPANRGTPITSPTYYFQQYPGQ